MKNDIFPNDPTECCDSDGDGVGDNSDECEGFDDNIDSDGMVFVMDVMILVILLKQLIQMEMV